MGLEPGAAGTPEPPRLQPAEKIPLPPRGPASGPRPGQPGRPSCGAGSSGGSDLRGQACVRAAWPAYRGRGCPPFQPERRGRGHPQWPWGGGASERERRRLAPGDTRSEGGEGPPGSRPLTPTHRCPGRTHSQARPVPEALLGRAVRPHGSGVQLGRGVTGLRGGCVAAGVGAPCLGQADRGLEPQAAGQVPRSVTGPIL